MNRNFSTSFTFFVCVYFLTGCENKPDEPFEATQTPIDQVHFYSIESLKESLSGTSTGGEIFTQQLPETDPSKISQIASVDGVEYWASFDHGEVCFALKITVEPVQPRPDDPATLGAGWTLASQCDPENTFEQNGIEIDAATSSRRVQAFLVPDGYSTISPKWKGITQNVYIR